MANAPRSAGVGADRRHNRPTAPQAIRKIALASTAAGRAPGLSTPLSAAEHQRDDRERRRAGQLSVDPPHRRGARGADEDAELPAGPAPPARSGRAGASPTRGRGRAGRAPTTRTARRSADTMSEPVSDAEDTAPRRRRPAPPGPRWRSRSSRQPERRAPRRGSGRVERPTDRRPSPPSRTNGAADRTTSSRVRLRSARRSAAGIPSAVTRTSTASSTSERSERAGHGNSSAATAAASAAA